MSTRLDELRRDRPSMLRSQQPFREAHLKHIGRAITATIAAGVRGPEFQARSRREVADTRRDCHRLAQLLKRLPQEQAEAVRFVLNQEYSILVYQFVLEAAGLINQPAMDRAKSTLDDADLESALASYDQLVHG